MFKSLKELFALRSIFSSYLRSSASIGGKKFLKKRLSLHQPKYNGV